MGKGKRTKKTKNDPECSTQNLFRKHKPHKKPELNSGAQESQAVLAPLVAPIVLLLVSIL